jgi:hypothetical protein
LLLKVNRIQTGKHGKGESVLQLDPLTCRSEWL